MNQFKRAQVVMLPTNNTINALKGYTNKSLLFKYSPKYKSIPAEVKYVSYFHLYIISDDEIKEGGLHITSDHEGYGDKKYKIIATTDTSLRINSTIRDIDELSMDYGKVLSILPQPSQQFIEKYIESYNKGEVITDVLVEYEDYDWDLLTSGNTTIHQRVKVNPKDNTITIKKLKNSWNREEVIRLLNKLNNTLNIGSDLTLEQWIEENL